MTPFIVARETHGERVVPAWLEALPTRMRILGVPEFAPTGSAGYLLDRYGMSPEGIADAYAAEHLDEPLGNGALRAIADQHRLRVHELLTEQQARHRRRGDHQAVGRRDVRAAVGRRQ